MDRHSIAVIGGDGIGPDVIREGQRVLETLSQATRSMDWEFREFPWGCAYYEEHGVMMPDDALKTLQPFDAIYFGAVGFPSVPDHISLHGLLLPIRQSFQQYINLRPIRLLPGVTSPLIGKGSDEIDFLCVRENTEGEYAGIGGRVHRETSMKSRSRPRFLHERRLSEWCATPSNSPSEPAVAMSPM